VSDVKSEEGCTSRSLRAESYARRADSLRPRTARNMDELEDSEVTKDIGEIDREGNDGSMLGKIFYSEPTVIGTAPIPAKDKNTTSFTFTVNDFSTIEGKLYSPEHEFGGYRWRLLVYPRGNNTKTRMTDYFSVYLDCRGPTEPSSLDDSKLPSLSWGQSASFKLILVAQEEGAMNVAKECSHKFSESSCDWGYQEFAPLRLFVDDTYVQNDSAIFEVQITLQDDQYDSRKNTGFAGFKNQGATCYMNSLLQTLYTLGLFRKGVYEMPLPDELNSNNIAYALQKVFYDLQKGQGVVKTKKLTRSFGWDTADAFTQHDVQELNRLLTGHLEDAMKKAKKPNFVSELFEGKLCNYIECVNVPFKSVKEEMFFDISLNVKDCRDIFESLDKYTEVEMLDGDNKYRADGYEELQEARMGQKILKLPPVLQLHLKRFDYDLYRDALVKINDRFEYGTEIDLSKYVEKSDGTDVYVLHSVLVHSGDVNGGHYFAYIRPDTDRDMWYKFDDEVVVEANTTEAVDDNFGVGGEVRDGNDGLVTMTPRRDLNSRKYTNAYWLQYIRKDTAKKILKTVSDGDIPSELEERLRKENEEEERRKKDRAEQYLYMYMAVATINDLNANTGTSLVSWDLVTDLRVKKTMLLSELKDLLKSRNLVDNPKRLRLWKIVALKNEATRLESEPLDWDDDRRLPDFFNDFLEDLHFASSYNMSDMSVKLFIEEVDEDEKLEKDPDENLIFVKQYCNSRYTHLRFINKYMLGNDEPLRAIVPKILETCDIPESELMFFHESSPSTLTAVDVDQPLQRMDPDTCGDVVVFQQIPSQEELAEADFKYNPTLPLGGRPMPTAVEYYEYVRLKTEIEFKNRHAPSEKGVRLELLLGDNYETIRKQLAAALGNGADPDRLRIADSQRGEPFGINEDIELDSVVKCVKLDANQEGKTLYYEHTDYPIQEFEEKEEVRVVWRPDGGALMTDNIESDDPNQPSKGSASISILLPYRSTYGDAVESLCERLNMPDMKNNIRLVYVEVKAALIVRIVNPSEVISCEHRQMRPMRDLRAEPILPEERSDGGRRVKLIQVVHIPKSRQQRVYKQTCFGSPFLLAVDIQGEKVADLRERIRQRMRVKKEEMDSWRLAEMFSSGLTFLEDENEVWMPQDKDYLAIEHKNPNSLMNSAYPFAKDKPLIIRS